VTSSGIEKTDGYILMGNVLGRACTQNHAIFKAGELMKKVGINNLEPGLGKSVVENTKTFRKVVASLLIFVARPVTVIREKQ
jgi:hypothetical protein